MMLIKQTKGSRVTASVQVGIDHALVLEENGEVIAVRALKENQNLSDLAIKRLANKILRGEL